MISKALFYVAVLTAGMSLATRAYADDVSLLSLEGRIEVSGDLKSFDGEFYRLQTSYGSLVVDAQGVICQGPACPDLTAPKATIRVVGVQHSGERLLPLVFAAFARSRGLAYEVVPAQAPAIWHANLRAPQDHKLLAEITFVPMLSSEANQAIAHGNADFMLSAQGAAGVARPIATEALVAIMAADNPTPFITTVGLAQVLSGEIKNWSDLGGPDMPIILHGLDAQNDIALALTARLGQEVKASVIHQDLASLAAGVASDPWSIAITGRADIGQAKIANLHDSCGFTLLPTPVSVKSEDYPLALPIYLNQAPRRVPLLAREFMEFLALPPAQAAITQSGYISRSLDRVSLTDDGSRLLNALRGAGEDVSLADLKRLAQVMDGGDRLSLTFRFEEGTADLDPSSQENLEYLARLLTSDSLENQSLVLAGFTDARGEAAANAILSRERAEAVATALQAIATDLRPDQLPQVEGFGEALPIACDETVIGRHLNRRVELWSVPRFTPAPL